LRLEQKLSQEHAGRNSCETAVPVFVATQNSLEQKWLDYHNFGMVRKF